MKKILLSVFIFFAFIDNQKAQTTTYYLIRHAEKDRTDASNQNPNLNDDGLKRAEKWAAYFENINLDAIYSTNYNRTMQTAKPTAEIKNLKIINYNPSKIYSYDFQNDTKGKTVLIVGHSNTTPFFANKILMKDEFKEMDDTDNATLFTITIIGETIKCHVKKIN
jgi:broad specificity phosphatase PhoE